MADRIGRRYEGKITGVIGWGLFVSLSNTVEGFVPIASLDDYYEFDAERRRLIASGTGRFFQMGDRVRIRVEAVNLDLHGGIGYKTQKRQAALLSRGLSYVYFPCSKR